MAVIQASNHVASAESRLQRWLQAHSEQGGPGVNGAVKYKDAAYVLQAALATDGSRLEKVTPPFQQAVTLTAPSLHGQVCISRT